MAGFSLLKYERIGKHRLKGKEIMQYAFVILLGFFLSLATANAEEAAEGYARAVYEKCEKQIPLATALEPILGNIEDVRRERLIRSCLKEEVLNIISKNLSKNEFINFNNALSEMEKVSFSVYKTLIFCLNNKDDSWCEERYKDDMSLEKLMLEKELTAQMKNILTSVFEYQQSF